jgi:type IV pilus assembly protein PilM
MAKSNAYWGIDIGQCALKALRCTLSADGKNVIADRYDYIEYPKILSQADAEPDVLIRDALKQFLSRNELNGDSVAISVPGQAGLSRFFKPPPVDAKTLPDIVKYEVKQQIPFPIDDVIWDWQQLGGTVVEGRTVDAEIGLFAMKREAVYKALRPFDEADVEVDLIQLSPLAIFNVVCHDIIDELPTSEKFDPENPPKSLVVMSMGTDTTDLIVSNGIKLWLRNIPIGGNHFTKILSRELKLTHAKAEHLKRNARQAEDPKTIFRAMRPVFADLVNEVQRSLTFFQSMDKTAEISKIVLLGNAARLPGLRQYLNNQLSLDIAKVGSFEKLKGPDVISQKSFSDNLLSFVPCYGLCLQGLRRGQINTNLLPIEIKTERIVRAKKPWILVSVGLVMLGLLFGYHSSNRAWARVTEEFSDGNKTWKTAIKEVDDQSAVSSKNVTEDGELKKKLSQLNLLSKELTASYDQRGRWIEIVSALHQAMPKDPRIKGNKVDPKQVPFEDREEIFIETMESKFFPDINSWYLSAKPLYESMLVSTGRKPAVTEGAQPNVATAGSTPETELKGPGYVIEIKAYHFRNSEKMVMNQDAAQAFVIRTLLNTLIDGSIEMPGPPENGGGEFKFTDFGIYYPVLIGGGDPREYQISFTSTDGTAAVASGESNLQETERVKKYQFSIQVAWIPRSPDERVAARDKRLADEAKAAEAKEQTASKDGNK